MERLRFVGCPANDQEQLLALEKLLRNVGLEASDHDFATKLAAQLMQGSLYNVRVSVGGLQV